MADLTKVSKQELIDELGTREGISVYPIADENVYEIRAFDSSGFFDILEKYHGPVHIITVVD